eukprot:587763_1
MSENSNNGDKKQGYFTIIFDPSLNIPEVVRTAKEMYLGRSNTNRATSTAHFCAIGNFKNVSRTHGHIWFDTTLQQWMIKVLGSKGAFIDNQTFGQNGITQLSNDKPTAIKMGNSKFYFLPPKIGKNTGNHDLSAHGTRA